MAKDKTITLDVNGRAEQVDVPPHRTLLEALRLIQSSPFVAVQFNAGSAALPVLRKYIALVLGGDPIEADALEQLG